MAIRVLGLVEQSNKGKFRTGCSCLPWHPVWKLCSQCDLTARGGLEEVVMITASYKGAPHQSVSTHSRMSAVSSPPVLSVTHKLRKYIWRGRNSCRPLSLPSHIPALWGTEVCGSSYLICGFLTKTGTQIFFCLSHNRLLQTMINHNERST